MENLSFVIEDDLDLARIFSEALVAAGFEVETLCDGAKAEQRLKEVRPSLIVLDMHLPNVSGSDLLLQIRADERFDNARIIILTADALLGDYYKDKADLVLIKPVSFSQLRDLTARYKAQ
jgi:DNA-binding response OmpR family regulator